MKLIDVLDNNHVEMDRPDVYDAIAASHDEYLLEEDLVMAPQLMFALNWVENPHNVPKEERIMRMGWAACSGVCGSDELGTSLEGGPPKLGIFLLTNKHFIFIRKESGGFETEAVVLKYPRKYISHTSQAGQQVWPLNALLGGLQKVSFRFRRRKQEIVLERVQKDNAAFLVEELKKQPKGKRLSGSSTGGSMNGSFNASFNASFRDSMSGSFRSWSDSTRRSMLSKTESTRSMY